MLNAKVAAGESIIGTWVSLGDPAIIELLCQTGFDFLLVDGEHSPITETMLKHIVIAAHRFDTAIIYRVRANQESFIKGALDLGVDGIMVPMVCTAEQAQAAVNAARYAPLGSRGIGPWRASNYYDELETYINSANQQVSVWLQIEHATAVTNVAEILSVEGYDAAFIGPADLTASLGVYPDTQHPKAMTAFETVIDHCARAKKPVGFDAASTDHIAQLRSQGVQIFTIGLDVSYIMDGARAMSMAARTALVRGLE